MGTSCIVYSVPRSGTHMIMSMLKILGYTDVNLPWNVNFDNIPLEDYFLFAAHSPCSRGNREAFLGCDLKGIYIKRDPRDVVLSIWNYAMTHLDDRGFDIIREIESKELQINMIINGIGFGNLNRIYKSNRGWQEIERVLTFTYEEVYKDPKQAFKKICNHLEIPYSKGKLTRWTKQFKEGEKRYGSYFNGGGIGKWIRHFTDSNIQNFKENYSKLMEVEGYKWQTYVE